MIKKSQAMMTVTLIESARTLSCRSASESEDICAQKIAITSISAILAS